MNTVKNILDFLSFENSIYLVLAVTCLSMVYAHLKNAVFQVLVDTLGWKVSIIEFKARFLTFVLLYSIVYGITYLIAIFN